MKFWKLKQPNFLQTEHIVFRAELLWRELGRKMTVCPKCEIAAGSDDNATNIFVLVADAIRKVVQKTIFQNVLLSQARGHLGTFGPTQDLDILRLADPGCCSFFRNT